LQRSIDLIGEIAMQSSALHLVRFPHPVALELGTSEVFPAVAGCRQIPGLDGALEELGIFVGSGRLWEAVEKTAVAADSDLPVLLTGETGTGKERFARLIHRLSPRRHRELVAINCAAIPKEIAESYLFGHIKGAFTGAVGDKRGTFEDAHGSTLLLDEIGELPLEVQAKLLRVIENGVVQRVGCTALHRVDVRIVAATNRNLCREGSAGRFREDLFFRLAVVQIELPSLRERRSEIAALAIALLDKINQKRREPRRLSNAALRRLEQSDWPGNVRQLANVLERSVLYARDDVLSAEDLLMSHCDVRNDSDGSAPDPVDGFSLERYLAQVRAQLILRALQKSHGNQSEASRLLGISKQAVSKFLRGQSVYAG
jgi:transcriptional regulator with GAF, ATPase, and Fis domain